MMYCTLLEIEKKQFNLQNRSNMPTVIKQQQVPDAKIVNRKVVQDYSTIYKNGFEKWANTDPKKANK